MKKIKIFVFLFILGMVNILYSQGFIQVQYNPTVDNHRYGTEHSEQYSTIRLNLYSKNSLRSGTGFFFTIDSDSFTICTIVTAKHNILNKDSILFQVCSLDKDGIPSYDVYIKYKLKSNSWIISKDSSLDYAMHIFYIWPKGKSYSYISNCFEIINPKNKIPFISWFSEYNIPTIDQLYVFDYYEKIKFIGFPLDPMLGKYRFPIQRTGNIASFINYNENPKHFFYINASVYGGSSGSPVFADYWSTNGLESHNFLPRYTLLGIITSTKTLSDDNFIDKEIGIGKVIKINELLQLIREIRQKFNDSESMYLQY